MDAAELAALGDSLAVPSVVCLWIAVLLRAPAALRSPQQRGLWLAVATAAAAMTLNLPAVVTYAMRDPDYAHTVGLVRNLIGVLSAGTVLYFVAAATRGRALQLASWIGTVAWLTTLVVLDTAAPAHTAHTIPPHGGPVPSLAYWLFLISAHLLANTTCVSLCWRYSRRTESGDSPPGCGCSASAPPSPACSGSRTSSRPCSAAPGRCPHCP